MVVTLYTADIPGDGKIYSPRVLEVAAAILYEDVRRGWPVLTGRSRGGLRYDLERVNASSVRMVLTDKQAYARYVAEKWYPLDRRLGPAAVREALAKALTIPPDATEIPSRLPDVDGMGASSRPVQIQGTNQNPPAPAGPPPPPANPTAAAQQKALGQIPDSQANKPTAAATVFAPAKKVTLKKLKERFKNLGIQYQATAVGESGRDALDSVMDYAEKHYPEELKELRRVRSSKNKKWSAFVRYRRYDDGSGRGPQSLYLPRQHWDKTGGVPGSKIEKWADTYRQNYWYRLKEDGNFKAQRQKPGEVAPPPGWMSVEEADRIRVERIKAQRLKDSSYNVGKDGRFGRKQVTKAERLRGTLTHELGHVFHNAHNLTDLNEDAVYAAFRKATGAPDWKVWAQEISGYAETLLSEATAEAFALREIYGVEHLPAPARQWLEYLADRPVGQNLDESVPL